MIKIYYGSPSIFGRKVLTVLEEKNLDYEIQWMSFKNADHQKEDYLKINPNGEVPALDDEGVIVYESTAMIEYLDEEYPDPPLMPKLSHLRAQVRMIDDFCDLHMYPPIRVVAKKMILHQEQPHEDDRKAISLGLQRMSLYLGEKPFLVGSFFSLADCAFMPVIASLESLGLADLMSAAPQNLRMYSGKLKNRAGYKGASLIKPVS